MSHSDDATVTEHLQPSGSCAEFTCPHSIGRSLQDWISIARPEQHYKQLLILVGIAFAYYVNQPQFSSVLLGQILIGLFSVCLIASSNYVLNGILDAATDCHHPRKRGRPIVQSRIRAADAYKLWLILSLLGLVLAIRIGGRFALLVAVFQVMALAYNVPPVRLKNVAYLDFVAEGLNSPLRLAMGWYLIAPNSRLNWLLLLGAWTAGAAAMAGKRLAELKEFADSRMAVAYRRSFAAYNEQRLFAIVVFAAVVTGFLGIVLLCYT